MSRILIIDDEPILCKYLSDVLRIAKHEAHHVHTLKDGIALLSQDFFDVVFLDVQLPDGNGLNSLMQMRGAPSSPEIIIITGAADQAGAEAAIKNGAWDYIQKPFSAAQVNDCMSSVLQYQREKADRSSQKMIVHNIVGDSPEMKLCFAQLAPVAFSDGSVLITGETGTGKELFARAIHDNSKRKNNNFITVDCAVLSESLVESTLFGHEKGAFTSAETSQEGLVNQAHRGTLFLDEVGELPLSVQRAFLRVIQEHRFRPVGGRDEVKSEFRLIAATNRNLDQMVEQGTFRHDLLYRLRSSLIELPPLRDRSGDIKALTAYYLKNLSDHYRINEKKVSADFMAILTKYHWPGNVRELINALDKSISTAHDCSTLFSMHLPTNIRIKVTQSSVESATEYCTEPKIRNNPADPMTDLKDMLTSAEKKYLRKLISYTNGNMKEICQISGLSRSRVYERLKKYAISRHA